uniref:Uncharacterized protein n=1 Tax=Oryza brachyantha TaxID=4533 RepID=J3L3V2_ORYBR
MSRIDSKGGVDGGVTVDVTLSPNAVLPGFAKRPPDATGAGRSSCRGFPRRARAAAAEVWAFASDGAGCRVAFALKAGIAMLLASLLALAGEPFRLFGTNIVWSILTVGIMFEYTVGASFNRGFNRAVGSTVAGVVAIVVIWVSLRCGSVAEPYVIGLSIFLIGAVTSFVKQLPALAPYEHGFRVILFTYCLIVVSAYRVREPIAAALDRLYAIAIGAALALLVNVLVFPAWAGEQLHRELVASFAAVADSLHDCVRCYLTGDETIDDGGLSGGSEPSIEKCRATLNASARIDSLAPDGVREAFRAEIKDAAEQAADLVRSMGSDVDGMTRSSAERLSLLKGVHGSAYRLQLALALNSQLLVSSGSESEVNETSGLQERSCSRLRESTRRQRLSWPSREADELEEMEAGGGYAAMVRMRALKSTRALSLATFASLLLEFVARLDHLVDTVDDLSKLAKFREESDPM